MPDAKMPFAATVPDCCGTVFVAVAGAAGGLGISGGGAFAFWGGDFWVFLAKDTDAATIVYQFDSTTGALKGMRVELGEAPTTAIDFAPRKMASRSLALGPTQVRCVLRSLASGDEAGMSQLNPLGRCVVTVSSTSVIYLPSVAMVRAWSRS